MDNKTLGNIFKGDKVIWMVFFFLCIISIVEVFSASSELTYGGSYWGPVVKHCGILIVGIFLMVVTLNVKCKYFKIVTPFLLVISFFTLTTLTEFALLLPKILSVGCKWLLLIS